MIDKLLRVFEECIREHPDQWHVMEPIWAPAARSVAGEDPIGAAAPVFPAIRDTPVEEVKVG